MRKQNIIIIVNKDNPTLQNPGKLSQEFCFAEFLSFLPLQRETQCLWQNLIAKAAKAVNRHTVPEFGNQNAGFKGGKTFQGENPGKQSQKAHISGRLSKAPEGGLCLTAGAAGQKNRDRPFFGQSLFLEPGKGMCPG